MATYLVTKLNTGKRNTYLCNTNSPSSTMSIPGDYIQISYTNVDNLFNMNTELPVYNVIYFDSSGTKQNVYICQNSFEDVFQYFKSNYGISNFQSINKTPYTWYELR